MAPIEEVPDEELIELLKNDPDADRLIGNVEAALTNLREIAGKNGGTEVSLAPEKA
jgi:hypothetical protein